MNMTRLQSFFVFLAFAAIFVITECAAAEAVVVFRNVNVVPMDSERVLENQFVIVRGDRISKIAGVAVVEIPDRATVIDAEGMFLIPGLADMHVHFGVPQGDNEQMLKAYVAAGVTTVLNMNGQPGHLRLREQIAKGEVLGPTIFTTGPIIRGMPPHNAEEGERMVRAQHKQGYDLIKPYNQVPEDAYWAMMKTAKELRMQVIGHAVRAVGIEGVLKAGQHIAHGEEFLYGYFDPPFGLSPGEPAQTLEDLKKREEQILDESKIPELARKVKNAGIYVTPNLSAYHMIQLQLKDLDAMLARPEVRYVPASLRRTWQADRNEYTTRRQIDRFRLSIELRMPFLRKLTKAFQDAGVPLLMGTDSYGVANIVPGFSSHDDLQELVDSGLSPYQALLAATRRPAEFLGEAGEFGRIAEGLRADLILLETNPLEEIGNTKRRVGVMLRGEWFDAARLETTLKSLAN